MFSFLKNLQSQVRRITCQINSKFFSLSFIILHTLVHLHPIGLKLMDSAIWNKLLSTNRHFQASLSHRRQSKTKFLHFHLLFSVPVIIYISKLPFPFIKVTLHVSSQSFYQAPMFILLTKHFSSLTSKTTIISPARFIIHIYMLITYRDLHV